MTESDIGDYDSDFEYPEEDFVEPEWDPEPEPDILPRIPPSQPSDAQKREHAAIEEVVECMNRNGIRFDTLVYALCYGNPLCSSDNGKLKVARNQLMKSSKLPTILDHLHTPPSYTGARPEAASKTLDEWSWKHVTKLSRIELDHFAVDARKEFEKCDDEIEDLTNFDNLNFDALKSKALLFTPNLLQFLTNIGETKTHARNRRRENSEAGLEPSFASVMSIHSLAFQMTPRCNRLQKQLSLYFRSKHAPKSLFTLFNKCGYVSSYIWSSNAIRSLSEAQLKKLKDLVANHAIFWIYDNLRLAIPMKAQCGDRHTVTDNGTAMTVVAIPDAVKHIFMEDIPTTTPSPEPPVAQDTSSISPMAQDETRDNAIPHDNAPTTQDHTPDNVPAATEASSPPALSWDDFSDVDRYKRLTAYNIYFIIDILFKTVPGLADLDIRNDESLLAPPSRHMMASGEDFKTLYHMLGITPVDETTIGDSWLRQT
ncbi:unnamed protein product [Rhizoctonia solani]|uniref:Uncharacterized protein n=1 Tax=Rhizoctonia solani TaxID=456999 RepID=A0A8H3DYT5_9AGAM|nr:unnamed protein product [Rhizoctonia solani]